MTPERKPQTTDSRVYLVILLLVGSDLAEEIISSFPYFRAQRERKKLWDLAAGRQLAGRPTKLNFGGPRGRPREVTATTGGHGNHGRPRESTRVHASPRGAKRVRAGPRGAKRGHGRPLGARATFYFCAP